MKGQEVVKTVSIYGEFDRNRIWNAAMGLVNQIRHIIRKRVACRIIPLSKPVETLKEFKGERRKLISHFTAQDESIKVIIENR